MLRDCPTRYWSDGGGVTQRREPNFLLGGTSAGGTSFLSAILLQHPEIYLPRMMRPEPNFFFKSWEYEQGIDYYLNRWFNEVPDSVTAIGERSSSYLYGGTVVAKRINYHLPYANIIFILRNPIERAWANYRFTVLEGLEDLSFDRALEIESYRTTTASGIWEEIQPHDYTGRGYYGKQLTEYLECIDESQILVLRSEDLRVETDRQLTHVFSFLGLKDQTPTLQRPSDFTSLSVVDPQVQVRTRQYFGERFDRIIEAIRDGSDPYRYSESVKDNDWIESLERNLTGEKSAMPESTRSLLKELYRDDVYLLSTVVNFDPTSWLA